MRRALWAGIFLLAGCGAPYGKRVPERLVDELPYESRIDLLEAENDFAVAVDKVDVAKNEIHRTRVSIRRAKSQADRADDELDEAKDEGSRQVAELALEEIRARIEFLRARQEVNAEQEDLAEFALRCARARFELARLNAVRDAKVKGYDDLSPKDFQRQVTDCDQALAEKKKDHPPETERLKAARAAWEKSKEALAKRTFTARASPYVE